MTELLHSAADLAARIPDGALLALAPDYSGCAMAVVRELVRRGARDLRLLGVPQLGLQADILIGAGCVASVEAAAVGLGEHGAAPCFQRAALAGSLAVRDSTCPAIHAALTAAERGVPFMPLAGVLGSDLVAARPDWRVIEDPTGGGPILAVPALRPDVALIHAEIADRDGNVWIGVRREMMTMAHAARATLASVEELAPGPLLAGLHAAGTIPSIYVDAVAVVPGGAWPIGCGDRYPADQAFVAAYAEAARTAQGSARFVESWLAGR
ncbi:MAG TPA: CoA-transferase [Geminicoccaceae bacterium]|nr:CoA-transferase [Geminicoccus sp.]HMU51590.1 CoA-transferase [Geminicoccaceae bacterium]